MKDDTRWVLAVGAGLVLLSLALYTVHYLLFSDLHHIMVFGLHELAFIPVEVLVVTLIIDRMLESREKGMRREKLNMVIGTFFSTAGIPLLGMLVNADPATGSLRDRLVVRDRWTKDDFMTVREVLRTYDCNVEIDRIDLGAVREFLTANQDFLLRLEENPMIFEHESFTDLILAISHLSEELKARDSFTGLPKEDTGHLAIDLHRVYSRLIPEWLRYMEYLQDHYPYLFHLAMRKNPFDSSASVIIRSAV